MKVRSLNLFLILVLTLSMFGAGAARAQEEALGAPIWLKVGTFVPSRGESLALAEGLTIQDYAAGQVGAYLVQFRGPVQEAWKAEVSAQGGVVLDYIPDFAFKVRMTPAQAQSVAKLANVAWVGVFQPGYKISPTLDRSGLRLYRVQIEAGADLAALAAAVDSFRVSVVDRSGNIAIVVADSAQVDALAQLVDVAWIENFTFPERHGVTANEYGAGSIMGAAIANGRGFDGSTQIVGVADTGLGGGTAATAHADIPASRIVAINNWPGANSAFCYVVTNDGAIDVDSGHGTHVAASVLSDGGASGEGQGTAPAARLVFQAVENYADMRQLCASNPDGYYLIGIPADNRQLFQQAYDAGARLHSNSWGSTVNGDYTSDSVNVDDFMWTHKDMLISFSAGNDGIDANSDGAVDNDSLGSPATAKNTLTVGASENDRQGNWQCDNALTYINPSTGTSCNSQGGVNDIFTYGSAWPTDFPANPIASDVSAGNAQQMAAFSSRGPTDDGRIKPDVVAPGTWILSGYSNLYQEGYDPSANPQNGLFQYDGWGFPINAAYKYMGGTSMSNPLTAGGAAVVRDYYKEAKLIDASAALVKATLINSAVDLLDENNDGVNDNDFPIPNNHEGWGLVNLDAATDGSLQFVEAAGLSTGGADNYSAVVSTGGSPLKITVVWTDYPSTAAATVNLVNNLDLTVTAPGGAVVYRGNVFSGGWSATGGAADNRNNVENVYIQGATAGTYTIQISGFNVPNGPQPYALVVEGATLSAPPPPTSTGYLSPTANAAVTSSAGDNNGYQTNPANAHANDGLFAVDTNSGSNNNSSCTNNGKDKHLYHDYNIAIPSGTVQGIQVRLDARADATAGAPKICVQLSWNGGASWTTAKSTATLTTSEATYTLGGTADNWGRSWALSELNNTNFRVRVINVATNANRDFSLDWVAVNVTYQP